ncbi:hypothetical protein SAMN05421813_10267 [Daejeonella rubra]|uniref:Uncharacterized protein n=1 Tax=Daejeonella rubra TaxID=990371 RepID=A0A1G9MQ87_9SPHI|nr:hypothetical protein SAMN05421813_10267 [Daejeonella rubra]
MLFIQYQFYSGYNDKEQSGNLTIIVSVLHKKLIQWGFPGLLIYNRLEIFNLKLSLAAGVLINGILEKFLPDY